MTPMMTPARQVREKRTAATITQNIKIIPIMLDTAMILWALAAPSSAAFRVFLYILKAQTAAVSVPASSPTL